MQAQAARVFGPAGEISPAFNLDTFALQLEKSCWVYASVYRIAAALAAIGCRVVETGTQNEAQGPDADEIRSILRRVNKDQTQYDFFEALYVYLQYDGEAYVEKGRDRFGKTREFFTMDPAKTFPQPDPTGARLVSGYKVRVGAGVVDLGPDDVIACRVFNPRSPWRGMSPLASVRTEVQADMAASLYNLSLLKNGGRHGGVVAPAEGDELDDAGYNRLIKQLEERNWGPENVGRILLLPAGMKFTPDGQSMKDMDFLMLRKFSREGVSAVTGAAPILIQNYDSASYANSEQQLKAFWDYTGKPLMLKLLGSFNEHWINVEYGEEISLAPDYVGIDALVDSEEKRIKNAELMVKGGLITVNEGRARIGYKALTDGDKLMVQGAVVPMDTDNLENPLVTAAATQPDIAGSGAGAPGDQQSESSNAKPGPRAVASLFDPPTHNGHRNGHARNGTSAKVSQASLDREVLRVAHLKGLAQSERMFTRRVDGVLRRQLGEVLRRLDVHREHVKAEDLIPSVEAEARWMFGELAPPLLEIVADSGVRTLRRLGFVAEDDRARSFVGGEWKRRRISVGGSFSLGNRRIAEHIEKHFFHHLERENATTMDRLERVIEEFKAGAAAGEGVGELVRRIEGMPEFGGARAESIARTETIGATNLGAQEGFVATETPKKSWLSTRDGERVRPSHQLVDDTTSAKPILTAEKFTLEEDGRGSAQLLFPGDPNSPGWAAINCRCAMVPEEDEQRAAWVEECKRELAEAHT